MSNERTSIETSSASIPELLQHCKELLTRIRLVLPTAGRINELTRQRNEILEQIRAHGPALEHASNLQEQERTLDEEIEALLGPFNEARDAVRFFAGQLQDAFRVMVPDPALGSIQAELENLAASYLRRSRSFFSLERAHKDLLIVRSRLLYLSDPLKHAQEPPGDAGNKEKKTGRGRRPISEDDQKTLAATLKPHIKGDRWKKPENLETICERLDRKGVQGPSGRSWSRALEDDETKLVKNIRSRLQSARYPAKNYLDQ